MALLLNRDTVRELLDMKATIEITERAFIELAKGSALLPQRTPLKIEQGPGVALFMPSYIPELEALGAKIVTVFGRNPEDYELPAVLGTIVLLDPATGAPVCIMEGGLLTAMRTAGVSGVATKFLARRDSKVHALFGSGVQARTQAWAVAESAKLEQCLVFSLDPPEQQRVFCDWVSKVTGVPTSVAADARSAVEACDILTLATSAHDPIIDGAWVKPGTHINGIGSHAPGMREIDTLTVQKSKVVCDLVSACQAEAGDLIIPVDNDQWNWKDVHGDLGQVLCGQIAGRESPQEITLFKSVGLAIQDLSVARYVYEQAVAAGAGREFKFI